MTRSVQKILTDHANRHDGGRPVVWTELTDEEKINLRGADLSGADLSGADLFRANLHEADLSEADLSEADLSGADLREANLHGAELSDAPIVENLDAKILDLIDSGQGKLEMATWHMCETTHCRAGWAIHLAGDEGKELENKYGSSVAGTLIYHASAGYVPNFYASNETAMADIRQRAAA